MNARLNHFNRTCDGTHSVGGERVGSSGHMQIEDLSSKQLTSNKERRLSVLIESVDENKYEV
jgi:hypothetical protein